MAAIWLNSPEAASRLACALNWWLRSVKKERTAGREGDVRFTRYNNDNTRSVWCER
jgi:hypothetical protein